MRLLCLTAVLVFTAFSSALAQTEMGVFSPEQARAEALKFFDDIGLKVTPDQVHGPEMRAGQHDNCKLPMYYFEAERPVGIQQCDGHRSWNRKTCPTGKACLWINVNNPHVLTYSDGIVEARSKPLSGISAYNEAIALAGRRNIDLSGPGVRSAMEDTGESWNQEFWGTGDPVKDQKRREEQQKAPEECEEKYSFTWSMEKPVCNLGMIFSERGQVLEYTESRPVHLGWQPQVSLKQAHQSAEMYSKRYDGPSPGLERGFLSLKAGSCPSISYEWLMYFKDNESDYIYVDETGQADLVLQTVIRQPRREIEGLPPMSN